MTEVSEIREKTKEEMIKKWGTVRVYPQINRHQGNFVPEYYPLNFHDYAISFSISAIEYHLRMLDDTKRYIAQIQKNGLLFSNQKEEKYAVQRLENAMTLLENHRAELIYINFKEEMKKLRNLILKKELEQADFNLTVLYHQFDKDGHVKPYLNVQEEESRRSEDEDANSN